MAHVVARHCGFHPYEINASDDRTATTLTQRINDAVQMRAVMGDGRPNCVIVDEVDGATGGAEGSSAVTALLRIVNAGIGGKSGAAGDKAGGPDDARGDKGSSKAGSPAAAVKVTRRGGGGSKAQPPLRRPIICICNDLYAPSLRPLRAVARVVHFRPPLRDRLVSRLQQVCEKEGVKADKQALQALVERTDHDVRACLNTLQFLARRVRWGGGGGGGRITLHAVQQLAIGSKDATRNAIGLWNDLLQDKPRKGGKGGTLEAGNKSKELWDNIINFNEHELLLSGLFENLHSVRFLDINFHRTSSMADRIAQADAMMRVAKQRSEYALMQYVPPAMAYCHLQAAQPERPNIVWPRAQGEAFARQQATEETLRCWAGSLAASAAQAHRKQALVTDMLPALKTLLAPPIRALAAHLLSPSEQHLMASTVGVMLDYAVQYDFHVAAVQDLARAGAGMYKPGFTHGNQAAGQPGFRPVPLKPALDTLHSYAICSGAVGGVAGVAAPASGAGPHAAGAAAAPSLPLVVRQMLTQQATQEAIRRAEAVKRGGEGASVASPTGGVLSKDQQGAAAGGATKGAGRSALAKPAAAGIKPGVASPIKKQQNWLEALRSKTGRRKLPAARGPAAAAGDTAAGAQADENQAGNGGALGAGGAAAAAVPAPGDASRPELKVLYRFNEGYTNAVKRPLLVKELL